MKIFYELGLLDMSIARALMFVIVAVLRTLDLDSLVIGVGEFHSFTDISWCLKSSTLLGTKII